MKGFTQHHFQITPLWGWIQRRTAVTGPRSKLHYSGSGAGFTLIEVMLSVAILGMLTALSAPVYQSLQIRNDLDTTAVLIGQDLRRAIVLSRAVDGDSTWGVSMQGNNVTLFKGTSYLGRDTTYDEVIAVPTSITLTGLSEVVMAKLSGLPSVTGTITLTTNASTSRTVIINAQGMVII